MSSVSSVSGNSISSYFSNRITGLASGLDTEGMIENCVKGFQTKIQSLQQKQTKLQWKQDAFRSITDKLVALSQKYTSYTSSTNLMSPSFFTKSVLTTTQGENASKVSATGRGTSDVKINAVRQLATAARYATKPAFELPGYSAEAGTITASQALDMNADVKVSKLKGSMTLTYGSRTVDLSFDEREFFEKDGKFDINAFKDAIVKQLDDQRIVTDNGNSYLASEMIDVNVDETTGAVTFSDKKSANKLYISSISGTLKDTLGIKAGEDTHGFLLDADAVTETTTLKDYLKDKSATLTVDGVSKTIDFDEYENPEDLVDALNKKLGSNVKAELVDTEDGKKALSFKVKEGSTFSMTSEANEMLGFNKNGAANYVGNSLTMEDILGDVFDTEGYKPLTAVGDVTKSEKDGRYYDSKGNLVAGENDHTRIDADGNALYGFTINGAEITFTKETSMASLMSRVNSNEDAGVNLAYSKLTGEFVFTAKETGAGQKIEIGDGFGEKLFGKMGGSEGSSVEDSYRLSDVGQLLDSNNEKLVFTDDDGKQYTIRYDPDSNQFYKANMSGGVISPGKPIVITDQEQLKAGLKGYTAGRDAEFEIEVNGTTKQLTRSSNTFDLDGLSVTLKNKFDAYETDADGKTTLNPDKVVTFKTEADADKIVEAVKSFVDEYNAILKEVHDGYSTQPLEKNTSTHARYDPLTEDEKEDLSDSAIEAYEAKAKTGVLFGDSDLSSLYNRLRSAVTNGTNGADLRSIGISAGYSSGLTQLQIDETALRQAIADDPDKVGDIFSRSIDGGASSNGVVYTVKQTLDTYASTSIASPGILVKKAGTTLSSMSLLNNSVQDQIDDLDDQIETWQTKMGDKIDYYSNMFTKLEQLMNEMNSQSSALASLMGGNNA